MPSFDNSKPSEAALPPKRLPTPIIEDLWSYLKMEAFGAAVTDRTDVGFYR